MILFTKLELDPYAPGGDTFYGREELHCSYEWTAQLGVDGLVVWSSSMGMRQRCQPIADFMANTFGPFVAQLLATSKELRLREEGQHFSIFQMRRSYLP